MDPDVAKKVKNFFGSYRQRHYAKGQILIHAQDNPEFIYYLLSGRVKKYDISYRGDEVVLNIFSHPAFFPMSYAINQTPNRYFFEAETDVELQLAPTQEVLHFVKSHPDVAFDLLSRVYRGADGLLGRVAHMMASPAKSRVMYELLIEARRFGTKTSAGVEIAISDGDIGARSGLARETVNREMQKLKKEGLISIAPHAIIIKSAENLADSLGSEL